MDTARIDYLNIGLMFLSCAVAFVLPFELFLFSYAVLGPLHYLTEISWLHKRNYFTLKNGDWRLLFVFAVLILLSTYCLSIVGMITPIEDLAEPTRAALLDFYYLGTPLTFMAFASAAIMMLVKDRYVRWGAYLVIVIIGLALTSPGRTGFGYLLFAIFLPTLVHVFLFTGAFMLYGAMKSRSRTGYLSVVVLMVCAASFFVITPDFDWYSIGQRTKDSYDESFYGLNFEIFRILVPEQLFSTESALRFHPKIQDVIYHSNFGIVITRFIAFAYTYHYLNWFSKTKIIRWHEVSRPQLAVVIVLWLASVGLYAYDYYTGLAALYFLSFLHVYLEFPLNWMSFRGIGQELRAILATS